MSVENENSLEGYSTELIKFQLYPPEITIKGKDSNKEPYNIRIARVSGSSSLDITINHNFTTEDAALFLQRIRLDKQKLTDRVIAVQKAYSRSSRAYSQAVDVTQVIQLISILEGKL